MYARSTSRPAALRTIARRGASAALAVAAICASAEDSHAQLFLFALNGYGKVLVNDTQFYSLPSDLDVRAGVVYTQEEEWIDQAILGSDQYHLRLDGLVFKNGQRLDPKLPLNDAYWFRLAISPGGDVFALDYNGRVGQNGDVIYDLPDSSGKVYRDFLYHEGDRYALRNDGKIYRNANGTEVWDLPGDASTDSEQWIAFAYDDTADRIYCLRRDGIVRYVANGSANDGEFVVDLPDGTAPERFSALIQDPATQRLYALRFDGSVYSVDPTQSPANADLYTDYPGSGEEDQFFLAITLLLGEPIALRFDGRLYRGLVQDPVCELQGSRFRAIAATTTTPVATNVKAFKTVSSTYSTTCYPGDAIAFPLLASDVNTENLVFTLVSQPDGSTYDDLTSPPTFSWAPTVEGNFTLEVSVSDGVETPKLLKWKIKVKAADLDPEKNKKPVFQKLKKVQGLVGVPIAIPLRAYDADGDALTYTTGTLPLGMTFDAQTATIAWIPVVCTDKVTVEIFADDGSGKLAKGKIQIQVETPFWF
jgi:hypothetical protein